MLMCHSLSQLELADNSSSPSQYVFTRSSFIAKVKSSVNLSTFPLTKVTYELRLIDGQWEGKWRAQSDERFVTFPIKLN